MVDNLLITNLSFSCFLVFSLKLLVPSVSIPKAFITCVQPAVNPGVSIMEETE